MLTRTTTTNTINSNNSKNNYDKIKLSNKVFTLLKNFIVFIVEST